MHNIQNVLFARDFTPCSEVAARYALDLAVRADARLHVVHVDELTDSRFNPSERPLRGAERLRARLKAALEGTSSVTFDPGDARLEHAVVQGAAAAPALLGYAEANAVDVIVMGTSGRKGVRHLVLGSVASAVTRLAQCAVMVVPARLAESEAEATPIRSLLVATDFSEGARQALREARGLQTLYGASLEVLHVVETGFYRGLEGGALGGAVALDPAFTKELQRHMQSEWEAVGGSEGDASFSVRRGDPALGILQHAREQGSGLIVMGTIGQTGISRLLMGSVAERVLRESECPVFVTRARAYDETPPAAKPSR